MSYDQNNKGALFKNNKSKDTQPDYRGEIFVSPELAGKTISIAAWLREMGPNTKTPGHKYLSLSVSEKRTPSTSGSTHSTPLSTASTPDFDDDIPF